MQKRICLDTSAIFCALNREEGVEIVRRHLLSANRGTVEVYASFVTRTEIYYLTMQIHGEAAARRIMGLVDANAINWVESTPSLCEAAARLKAGHRISLADAFVAATTLQLGARLVHKDPEFESLASLVSLETLPYK